MNESLRTVPFPPDGSDSPAVRLAPLRQIGRYRIDRVLGKGGFGLVYLAYDEQLERLVAIKVPHGNRVSSAADAEAYLIEARTVANLDHPHIVPVYDVGSSGDCPCFIVSKYIDGTDLATKLKDARLSLHDSVELVATVAEALHFAHKQGLVHRDIKPANILVDKNGKPFVADFGLALREQDVGKGPNLNYAGTPAFMSPEQARGEGHRVDGRSDIFSLGVVFYALLTGRLPFCAETQVELRKQITCIDARPPRQINDHIPIELDRICLKALSKRASERYSAARDMADDLRHFLLGDLAEERATSTGKKNGAWGMATPLPTSTTPTLPSGQPVKIVPKGLRSFDAHDADFFLELLPGPRDRDGLPEGIRFWKSRIEGTVGDQPLSVGLIYGPSGCGKSSLVKAGLLPRLAKSILAIYIEATAEQTEARLLKGLRRQLPRLPDNLGLVDCLSALRRRQFLEPGLDVVLVLDQFEQWLYANNDEKDTQLVQALRHCDGERLRCLLIVRDDFWMAATRFMRDLEIRLIEDQNSTAVDLFPARHAEKVLASFGRAFGVLPEGSADGLKEQKEFLELAVAGLAQEGRVIPVRLALFVEMMKTKLWTPAKLREVGGALGVGITFLEEMFSAVSALPEHRYHQQAARSVLSALLPQSGTDIKGHTRSHAELLEASGYGNRLRDFDDLIRILDSEIRLITPIDLQEPSSTTSALPTFSERKHYQLTHDYLVPALRDWLASKQRESMRGRAELRLAECVGLWELRSKNRFLPSWWEWIQIGLFTRHQRWTASARRMMASANRRHGLRGLAFVTVFLLASGIGLALKQRLEAREQSARAAGLVAQLLVADLHEVPQIVAGMMESRPLVDPELRAIASDEERPSRERLRASLALLPFDSTQIVPVLQQVWNTEPDELLLLRSQLKPWRGEFLEALWEKARGQTSDGRQRLRVAALLADLAPDDPRWDELSKPAAQQLVKESLPALPYWQTALQPARRRLREPLAYIFRGGADQDPAERALATRILLDFASDDPPFLAELIKDADSRQFAQIAEKLTGVRANAAPILWKELDPGVSGNASEEARDRVARRQANAAIALYRLGEPAALWPLLKHSRDPQRRSYVIQLLSELGADPLPLASRWDQETDASVRSALILGLGEFAADRLDSVKRNELAAKFLDSWRRDADSGHHGALEWLLRRWGLEKSLRRFAAETTEAEARVKRSWYINGEGHTMVIVPVEKDAADAEKPRRSFAIATKEVSIEQFLHFRADYYHLAPPGAEGDYPVNVVSWFDAVSYCRWLSEREGIPEDQMCYPPIPEITSGMKMPQDFLARRGYRLPTEAEWEHACRAGTSTTRYFGEAGALLPHYAWFGGNSHNRPGKIAHLQPNAYGLFDMLGNAMEWCHGLVEPALGAEEADVIRNDTARVARGAGFHHQEESVRCTQRDPFPASTRWHSIGFRVARTVAD